MLTADATIQCWGWDQYTGRLGKGGVRMSDVPTPATEFNTGSANVQFVASGGNTYVNIE
jgi:hypothetical protein